MVGKCHSGCTSGCTVLCMMVFCCFLRLLNRDCTARLLAISFYHLPLFLHIHTENVFLLTNNVFLRVAYT